MVAQEQRNCPSHSSKPVARGMEYQEEGPRKESPLLQTGEDHQRDPEQEQQREQQDPRGQKRGQITHNLW